MGSDRILVVEDTKWWQNTLRRVLENQGYIVTVCDDAESVLEELSLDDYPVIIVDLRLHDQHDREGLRLIQEIDRLQPGNCIQKIIVSGWSFGPDELRQISQVIKSPAVFFVSKGGKGHGMDRDELISTVNLALDQYRVCGSESQLPPISSIPLTRGQRDRYESELARLQEIYDVWTRRIHAADLEITSALDRLQKQVFLEKRAEFVTEREEIMETMSRIERKLA